MRQRTLDGTALASHASSPDTSVGKQTVAWQADRTENGPEPRRLPPATSSPVITQTAPERRSPGNRFLGLESGVVPTPAVQPDALHPQPT